MKTDIQNIEILEKQLNEIERKHAKYLKNLPIFILLSILICFIAPFLPGRRTHKPMTDTFSYPVCLLILLPIFTIAFLFTHYKQLRKYKKDTEQLVAEISLLKNKRQEP